MNLKKQNKRITANLSKGFNCSFNLRILHRANSIDDEINKDQQKHGESTPEPKEKNPFSFNKSTPIKKEPQDEDVVLDLDNDDNENETNEKKTEEDKADDTLPLVDEG